MKLYMLFFVFFCFAKVQSQQAELQKAITFFENYEDKKADSILTKIEGKSLSIHQKVTYYYLYDNLKHTQNALQFYNSLSKQQFNKLTQKEKAFLLAHIADTYLNSWSVKKAYQYALQSKKYVAPLQQAKTIYDFFPHSVIALTNFGVEKYTQAAQQGTAIYQTMKPFNFSCSKTKRFINNGIGLATIHLVHKEVSLKVQEENLQCLLNNKGTKNVSLVTTYNNLGQSYIYFGYYNKALDHQLKAKQIIDTKLNGKYPYEWYWHMGWLNYQLGNYELFELYTTIASDMILKMGEAHFDNVLINRVFVDGYLRFGNLKKAKQHLKICNTFFEKYYKDSFLETYAQIQTQYGEVFFKEKKYKKAITYFQNSYNKLNQAEKQSDVNYTNLIHLIKANIALNNNAKAKTYISELKQRIGAIPSDTWHIKKIKIQLRLIEVKLNEFKNTEKAYIKLINELKNKSLMEDMLIKTYYELANYQYSKLNYTSAFNTVTEGIQFIQKNEALLLDENRIPAQSIDDLIGLGLKTTYELQKTDKQFIANFFLFQEMKRANSQKKIMAQKQLQSIKFVPDSILQKNNFLKNKIATLKTNLKSVSGTLRYQAQESLIEYQQKLQQFQKELKITYPKYFQVFNPELFSLKQVKSKITENTSVVSFSSVENTFYILLINNNSEEIIAVNNTNSFQKIEQMVYWLKINDIKNYKKTAFELYETIFKPITHKNLKTKVIWIPDEKTNYLNPEILLTDTKGTLYKELNYLIKKYQFSRIPSAFLTLSDTNLGKNKGKKAGFAPVFDDEIKKNYTHNSVKVDSSYLYLLQQPFSKKNIENLSKKENFDSFLRHDATETNFKEKANKYSIIHLATHTELNSVNPMNTKVYFTKSVTDTLNDGELFVYEIYSQRFKNDLAFLSACETAKGIKFTGNEFISLGHSFNYAGVKNLIYTLWQVDEKISQEISYNFYKKLGNSNAYASALQEVKLNYIKNANNSLASPFYWGGIVLQSGFETPKNNYFLYYVLAIIVVVVLVIAIQKLMNNKKA